MSDIYPAGLGTTPGPRERRDGKLTVRFSAPELDAIRTRSGALGVMPSRWVRAAVLDALDLRRGEVAALHRMASRRLLPREAEAIEQLRRVGVLMNQEQRLRNAGLKQLKAVAKALKAAGALDADLRAELVAAARALADPAQASLLSEGIEKVDGVRFELGDWTRQ